MNAENENRPVTASQLAAADWRLCVRGHRDARGLSAADVAQRVGISRAHMWNIETGRKQPTVPVAARLADALGLTLAELLGLAALPPDDGPRAPRISDLRDTLCYLRRHDHPETRGCPPSEKEAVRIVRALEARYSYQRARAHPADSEGAGLDVERRAVVAAARQFLAAHDRVIAENPVSRDSTFVMKNAADQLRDVLGLYDERAATPSSSPPETAEPG